MPILNTRPVLQNAEPGAPGGGPAAPAPGPAPAPSPNEGKTFSWEYVNELREENKGWRLKATQLTQERDNHKTAAERAAQDAEAKVKEAHTAAEQRVIRAELKAAALKAGMVDLDGLKLADLSKVKLSEAGEVEGATELMEAMKKSKPWLFNAATHTSTPGDPPRPSTAGAKKATDMTPEEYRAERAKAVRG